MLIDIIHIKESAKQSAVHYDEYEPAHAVREAIEKGNFIIETSDDSPEKVTITVLAHIKMEVEL